MFKNALKQWSLQMMAALRLYPHIFFNVSPFKIYEYLELVKELNGVQREVFLDIGCGYGLQTFLIGTKCKKVVGIDISAPAIGAAKQRAQLLKSRIDSEFHCSTLENAGFEDATFDKVFSFSVLEHIPNYDEVLREVYRILKPGGKFIFSMDSLEAIDDLVLRKKHQRDHHVHRYFRANEVERLLENIGFSNIRVYPIFRSGFAQKLFRNGIENQFRFTWPASIPLYWYLSLQEKKNAAQAKGIFLIAHGEKRPAGSGRTKKENLI